MNDLRTGLVEAMRRAMHEATDAASDGPQFWTTEAEAALDSALGFLTDNADEWEVQAALTGADYITNLHRIAALSDSRDTGEKPT